MTVADVEVHIEHALLERPTGTECRCGGWMSPEIPIEAAASAEYRRHIGTMVLAGSNRSLNAAAAAAPFRLARRE